MRTATTTAIVLGLLVPAVTVAGADQEVDVTVLPADTLTIEVEGEFGLGIVVPDSTTPEHGIWMNITNTYISQGWEVYVDGEDLQNFHWECDEFGDNCYRAIDGTYSIPETGFYLRGGDQNDWDDESAITAYEGNLGANPLLLMEGTAVARGGFGVDNPQPTIQLTVPSGTEVGYDYTATLTYTIQAPTP